MFAQLSAFHLRKTFALLLSAAVLCLPALAGARTAPSQSGSLQYIALPLERSPQNHLLVRAEINGKPAVLTVDTGAPISAIALNRRAHFKMLPVAGKSGIPSRLSINGAFNAVVIARNLRLGALNLVDEPMVVVDLGGLRSPSRSKHRDVDGILGADILFPTKAILDCRRQLLILKLNPTVPGRIPGIDYRGYRAVPMHVSQGFNLYVDGSLNGKKAKLMVDTGAFATLLNTGFVRRMKIPLRDTPYRSSGVNLGHRGVQVATISRFSVGSMDMRSNDVGVMNMDGLIHDGLLDATPPVAGLLGAEILRRYHAIIDFGTNTLYLKK